MVSVAAPPWWATKDFDPRQKRIPKGKPGGGRWLSLRAVADVLDGVDVPRNSRAPDLYGKGVSALFPDRGHGPSPMALTPWPAASRRREVDGRYFDPEVVRQGLADPPPPTRVDPRLLSATQPHLTYPGVDYYANDDTYRTTGRTFADQHQAGNRLPILYRHRTPFGDAIVILSGHHRAAAALVRGEPLDAILLEGP